MANNCTACEWIETLGKPQSNREYWLISEIFVKLHNGKDFCTVNDKHKINRIYLSGPISKPRQEGKDWKDPFKTQEARLEALGYSVFNPVLIGEMLEAKHINEGLAPPTQADYMTECSRILYEYFYAGGTMVMQKGWEESKGCQCEHGIAKALELKIIYEDPES